MIAPPEPRRIKLPDITLSVHEAGSGTPIVMCHGFPELAFSWSRQIQDLAAAGFRAIAADQRGYGKSDAPLEVTEYDLARLTDDMAHLLDALEIDRAVFVGHDFGGFVAWGMPVRHPDRCLGVIGVNTPNIPFPTRAEVKAAFGHDSDHYMLWMQEPGVAEAALEADLRWAFSNWMLPSIPLDPDTPPPALTGAALTELAHTEPSEAPLLDAEEIEFFVRAFERSGFRGPVNWYRNMDRNRELCPGFGTTKLDLPCLQVIAERDPWIPAAAAVATEMTCSDVEIHRIEEAGHWTLHEQPVVLSRIMINWLSARFADGDTETQPHSQPQLGRPKS